jgi:hypothetical protein
VVTEANVDVIRKKMRNLYLIFISFVLASTQTISDSYDDQEPTQPMKIWNGNSHNTNRKYRN